MLQLGGGDFPVQPGQRGVDHARGEEPPWAREEGGSGGDGRSGASKRAIVVGRAPKHPRHPALRGEGGAATGHEGRGYKSCEGNCGKATGHPGKRQMNEMISILVIIRQPPANAVIHAYS